MGQAGVDIILSPAAQRVFDLLIECKNVEALNVVGTFRDHYRKYADKPGLKLLIHRRNHVPPLVTMQFADFINIFQKVIAQEKQCNTSSSLATFAS